MHEGVHIAAHNPAHLKQPYSSQQLLIFIRNAEDMHTRAALNFLHVLCWYAVRSHCLNNNPFFDVWNFTFQSKGLTFHCQIPLWPKLSQCSFYVLYKLILYLSLAYSPTPLQAAMILVHSVRQFISWRGHWQKHHCTSLELLSWGRWATSANSLSTGKEGCP